MGPTYEEPLLDPRRGKEKKDDKNENMGLYKYENVTAKLKSNKHY